MVTTIQCACKHEDAQTCAAARYMNPAGYPCEPCECYCHTIMDEPDEFTESEE